MPDDARGRPSDPPAVPAGATIEDYFSEDRVFPPSDEFRRQAVVADPGVYERAGADWEGFWAEQAGTLDWFRPWDSVVEWDPPLRPLVRRRDPERLLQLPRSPRGGGPRRPGRLPLGGRAR